ncbi:MAG: hypothetical protein Q8O89_02245, partial [Nanoarchaeota archaeon]|nr:hypothetical protein [Nanoarchaeota archaeon]
VSLGLAINIFLIQQYLFPLTTPNVSKVSYEMSNYLNQNEFKTPLYIFRNNGFDIYLNEKYRKPILLEKPKLICKKNCFAKEDIGSYQYDLLMNYYRYSSIYYLEFNNASQISIEDLNKNLNEDGGTVVFIDFPEMNKSDPLWILINDSCNINKTFYSNGFKMGYVFTCPKSKVISNDVAKLINLQKVNK